MRGHKIRNSFFSFLLVGGWGCSPVEGRTSEFVNVDDFHYYHESKFVLFFDNCGQGCHLLNEAIRHKCMLRVVLDRAGHGSGLYATPNRHFLYDQNKN